MKLARAVASIVLVGIAACASTESLPVEAPEVRMLQRSAHAFAQERGGVVSIEYLLEITNLAEIPVKTKRIDLRTVETGPYIVRPQPFVIRREIGPNSTEVLELAAWAHSYGGRAASVEPVTMRVTIAFESDAGDFQISRVVRLAQ